jgi:hypothetical protein
VQDLLSTKSAVGSCKAHCWQQHKVSAFLLLHARRRKIIHPKAWRAHLRDAKNKNKNVDIRLAKITSKENASNIRVLSAFIIKIRTVLIKKIRTEVGIIKFW